MDLPPSAHPHRGWMVPLAVTVMVGFGVILYGFSVYATEGAAGGEFSTTTLSVAYGGALFVGGLLAFPVGRHADRRGVRQVVAGGTVLGFAGLAIFSVASESWHVIVAWWLLIGPAQAMVYYEPAYIAVNQWLPVRDRARALAVITVIGGLAGIVFIPLTAQLVNLLGWRTAVFALAVLLLVVGEATAVFALPSQGPTKAAGAAAPAVRVRISSLLGDQRFVLYTLALVLAFFVAQGVIAHRLARFEEAGFSLTSVALWAAVASALSLPGRWIAPMLAVRFGATHIQAVVTVIVALGVFLMVDGTRSWQMIGHFALFGLAFGALLPLRAMVMSGWYSGPAYGRIMGVQWTVAVLIGAAGPALVGVVRDASGGYATSALVLSALLLVAVVAIVASGRVEPAQASSSAERM